MQESRDKKLEEHFELTVDNYSQPTTLPLRTYYLITTSSRSTKGRVKEHLWVKPRWVYEWDTDTCMGEIPTHVWVRHLDSRGRANGKPQDRFSANPNGAPWVIWNRIGWKCVMLRVIPNEEWGVRKDAVEWVQRSNLFELCRAWASSAKPIRSCHAGCKHVRWTMDDVRCIFPKETAKSKTFVY